MQSLPKSVHRSPARVYDKARWALWVAAAAFTFGSHVVVGCSNEQSTLVTLPEYRLVEELRIASDEDSAELALTRVSSLATLSDGILFTAHPLDHTIRMYDPDGEFIRTIGREGEGPGEFATLTWIGQVRDTLWAFDSRLLRLTLFSRDGEPVRTVRVNREPGSAATVRGWTDHGGFLWGRVFGGPFQRDSVLWYLSDYTGASLDSVIIDRNASMQSIRLQLPEYGYQFPTPLSTQTQALVVPGGSRVVSVMNPSHFGGQPGVVRIVEVRSDGTRTQYDVQFDARPISTAQTDSIRNDVETVLGPSRRESLSARQLDELRSDFASQVTLPDHYPVVRAFAASASGAVWIQHFAPSQDVWSVIEGGKLTGRVQVPSGVVVHKITEDHVWATVTDANDVPAIIRFRLMAADQL